jgi:DNA-binding Xre family transcriptional regulator
LPNLITLMRLAAALDCKVGDLVAVFDEHGADTLLRATK